MRNRNTNRRAFLFLVGCVFASTSAFANQVFYGITVDTHTIAGSIGFLDFQFNPASLLAQSAFSEILNLTGAPVSGSPTITGDVGGGFPAPGLVVLNNDTPLNEYEQAFTFGPSLFFNLLVAGPALTNPGKFLAGTTFSFAILNSLKSPLLGTGPNGALMTLDVQAGGASTVTTFPPPGGGPPVITVSPEPASYLMLFSAVVVLGLAVVRRRTSRSIATPAAAE